MIVASIMKSPWLCCHHASHCRHKVNEVPMSSFPPDLGRLRRTLLRLSGPPPPLDPFAEHSRTGTSSEQAINNQLAVSDTVEASPSAAAADALGVLDVASLSCYPGANSVRTDTLLADRTRGSPLALPQICSGAHPWLPARVSSPLHAVHHCVVLGYMHRKMHSFQLSLPTILRSLPNKIRMRWHATVLWHHTFLQISMSKRVLSLI